MVAHEELEKREVALGDLSVGHDLLERDAQAQADGHLSSGGVSVRVRGREGCTGTG